MFGKKRLVLSWGGEGESRAGVYVCFSKRAVLKRQKQYPAKMEVSELLTQVRKDFGYDKMRVLLAEEKAYTVFFNVAQKEQLNRNLLLSLARELIPEDIDNFSFDYKIIGKNEENYQVQVVAAASGVVSLFKEAAFELKMEIEALEPISAALARLSGGQSQAQLIRYQELSVAAYRGVVYGVAVKGEEQLKAEVKEKYQLDLVDSQLGEIDPAVGLALKADIKGEDSSTLNLDLGGVKKRVGFWGKFLLLLGIILLVVLGWNRIGQKKNQVSKEVIVPKSEEKLTATQVREVNKAEVKIQILNGPEIKGLAGKTQKMLEALGYKNIIVGNAASSNLEKTVISTKKDYQHLVPLLTSDLNSSYTVDSNSQIHEDSLEFDVILLIGKSKNE